MSEVKNRLTIVEESKAYWRVIIDNPPVNLWDPWMFAELNVLMTKMETDRDLKVVVFESANEDFFMSHHDVKNRPYAAEQEGGAKFFHEWPNLVTRLNNCPVICITKVRGRAWAQGFEFALSCDMVFASKEKAKFSLVEVAGGSMPGGGGIDWLSARCGRHRAMEIVLSADAYDGDLAERYGFINRALPDAELDQFVDTLARRLAGFDHRSLLIGKKLVNARAGVPSTADLFTENYILNAFDNWKEGKEGYGDEKKAGPEITDQYEFELNMPAKFGPSINK